MNQNHSKSELDQIEPHCVSGNNQKWCNNMPESLKHINCPNRAENFLKTAEMVKNGTKSNQNETHSKSAPDKIGPH